jgi:putative hydrolase of the HAD superfamily
MQGTRAVLFDLDDTLYREHDYVRSGFAAVAKRLASEPSAPPADELYASLEREWLSNGRGRVFDAVTERFGLRVPVAELVEVYRDHEPELSLYPDAERALARLEASTRQFGVLTDGAAGVQRRKLRALGLDTRVPCIVVTDDYGVDASKPSLVPYRIALEQLELPAPEVVYVGDNPHKDFIGARALGMATVRVRRPVGDHAQTVLDREHEADRDIASLDELWA